LLAVSPSCDGVTVRQAEHLRGVMVKTERPTGGASRPL
jgi:hypothetical protein